VGLRDRVDDRQAETAPVGGRFLGPAVSFEGMVKEVGRKASAFV
jgi:hypothetical protein